MGRDGDWVAKGVAETCVNSSGTIKAQPASHNSRSIHSCCGSVCGTSNASRSSTVRQRCSVREHAPLGCAGIHILRSSSTQSKNYRFCGVKHGIGLTCCCRADTHCMHMHVSLPYAAGSSLRCLLTLCWDGHRRCCHCCPAPAAVAATQMPIWDHLEELRERVLVAMLAAAVAIGGCFCFSKELVLFLEAPVADAGVRFLQLSPGEFFFTTFKVRRSNCCFIHEYRQGKGSGYGVVLSLFYGAAGPQRPCGVALSKGSCTVIHHQNHHTSTITAALYAALCFVKHVTGSAAGWALQLPHAGRRPASAGPAAAGFEKLLPAPPLLTLSCSCC